MDPLSIVAGIVGTTAFALQAVTVLNDTLSSIKATNEDIAGLHDDVQSLQGVLRSLANIVDKHSSEFSLLETPLRCCGRTCTDFEKLLQTFSTPSRFKLIDWAKLRLKGQDISTLKKNLAVYKSTVCIAIGGINLQHNLATRELVSDYQNLVVETSKVLRDRVNNLTRTLEQDVEEKDTANAPGDYSLTRSELMDERTSAELCLRICDQVAGHLLEATSRIRAKVTDTSLPNAAKGAPLRVTVQKFHQARHVVQSLSAELQNLHLRYDHLLSANDNPTESSMTNEEISELKIGFANCLSFCEQGIEAAKNARISEYEHISGGARAHQWILSNFGDLLRVKDATVEDDGLQIIGQVDSDVTRQLSSDYTKLRQSSDKNANDEARPVRTNAPTPTGFFDRHGGDAAALLGYLNRAVSNLYTERFRTNSTAL